MALAVAERRLDLLQGVLDAGESGMLVIDAERRVVLWNRWLEQMSGMPRKDTIGRPLAELFPQLTQSRLFRAIDEALTRGKASLLSHALNKAALPLYKGGARNRPIQQVLYVKPLDLGDNGRFCVIQLSDVTAAVKRETLLREIAVEADRANKAKSEFLSRMSHELRTPLNAILGYAQLLGLEDDTPLSERRQQHVGDILKSGWHLLELINEILDLAVIETGKVGLQSEPVDPAEIIDECICLISPLAEQRGIRLDDRSEETACSEVIADRTRLKQVLTNLLSNAVKYNRDNGQVTLSCLRRPDGTVRLLVTDTGPGIAVDKRDRLFEPFERLGAEQTKVEGTGIGLVITKQLVELMNGRIGVDSVPGEGSTFWIELEAATDTGTPGVPDRAISAPAARPASQAHQATVLYIEDNPANLTLVKKILATRSEIRMLDAHDAELGLQLARLHQPDVILMDINLPGMDGYEALGKLTTYEETRQTPVLAISANAMPADIERGLAAGFARYLTKPIRINEFLAAIDEALG